MRRKRKLYAIGNWWCLHRRRVAVCVPAKCAGTSFYRGAYDVPKCVKDKTVLAWTRKHNVTRGSFSYLRAKEEADEFYLAVRDPVSRFRSLWRDKCRDATHATAGDPERRLYSLVGLSPTGLMSVIRNNPLLDAHWRHQGLDMHDGVQLVRYDRLLHVLGLPSVLCNETKARDDDILMPEQEILEHYSADMALWNQVKNDG